MTSTSLSGWNLERKPSQPTFFTMVKRSITTDPNAVKATLPIEWTQLKKRGNERAESNESESCCEDLLCCRTRHQRLLSAEVDTSKDEENIQGQAIFCMHKIDPEWFQGYFLVQGQTKPWGLLAIQEAIDKCLQWETSPKASGVFFAE